jgi:protein-disulfide isomerase
MVLGFPRARVTVTEYASVGCPHCAHWAKTDYPAFKAKYIDTGQVKFAFHEMLTGDGALAAAGFLLARCAGAPKYFQVVNDVFEKQNEIAARGAPALLVVAQAAGVTEERFKACLSDDAALKALSDRTEADAKAHNVLGTPTFFVDGVKLDGDGTLPTFDAAIARARSR